MTTETTTESSTAGAACAEFVSAPAFTFPEGLVAELRAGLTARALHDAVQDGADTLPGITALHEDVRVHDLERYLPQRRRQRGKFTTQYVEPFAEYTSHHADTGAMVFVDAADMRACAVLDLGTTDAPGHADHTAALQLRPTAAFQALIKFTDRPQRQQAVAEFFEDWAPHARIEFFAEGDTIPLGKALSALRRITIESLRKLDSEEQQLSANRTTFESVQASSKDPLPTTIYFSTQPYADLTEHTFALRLSIQTGGDAPLLVLRVQNMEQHVEEMGDELVALVRDHVADAVPVLLGTYAKGE